MAAPIEVDIDGRTVRLTNLDKVLVPVGVHQGRGGRLPPPHRSGDRPAPRRTMHHVPSLSRRHRPRRVLREALPRRTGPSGYRWRSGRAIDAVASSTAVSRSRRRWCGRRTWRRSNSMPRWRWLSTSTPPARWCSTSIRARRRRSSTAARWRWGTHRARRGRAAGLVQDLGFEGPPAVRAAQHAGCDARGRLRTSRSPSAR